MGVNYTHELSISNGESATLSLVDADNDPLARSESPSGGAVVRLRARHLDDWQP